MNHGNSRDFFDTLLKSIDGMLYTQPTEALVDCEKIFLEADPLHHADAYIEAAERYGKIMDHLGRSLEARDRLFVAQQLAQSASLYAHEAQLMEQIARGYYSTSEHRLAIQYWARSIEICDLCKGKASTWILAKIGLAQVYFGLKDYASGLVLLKDADRKIASTNDPHLSVKIKINLGVCLLETGYRKEAIEMFNLALTMCPNHQFLDHIAESNFYLGRLALAEKELGRASEFLNNALTAARSINYSWCEANILSTLAQVHARHEHYREALDIVLMAQAVALPNNFLHLLTQQHFAAAQYAELLGDFRLSITEFKAGYDCEQKVMAANSTERNQELEEKVGLRPSATRLLVELSNHPVINQGELEPAFQKIAKESSRILSASRASLWLLDRDEGLLVCRCMYIGEKNVFVREAPLLKNICPIYFQRLSDSHPLAAQDAQHHPQTAELFRLYLKPRNIQSMLTIPIQMGGTTAGVLCFEIVGKQRNWTLDAIQHATQIAEVSARVIAGFEHKQFREQISTLNTKILHANKILEEQVVERTVSLERHARDLHELNDRLSQMHEHMDQGSTPATNQNVPQKIREDVRQTLEDVAPLVVSIGDLSASETRFHDLLTLASDWCWEQDAQFCTTHIEGNGIERSGLRKEEMLGKCHWEYPTLNLTVEEWGAHKKQLERGEDFVDLELRMPDLGAAQHWISISGHAIFDTDEKLVGYRGIGKDITDRKLKEDRIRYHATHDMLTGLPNRALFSEFLNRTLQSARRYDRQFSVVFIDLDRFKIINDSLGHEAGDDLLKTISLRLKECVRTSDVVARLGGDEFVVLLQETTNKENIVTIAEKILAAVVKPITLLNQECRISASVGICMYSGEEDEQTLMKNADIAMYQAKADGKNNYRFFSSTIVSQTLERVILENNLRRAVELRQFFLHYQAKVDLKTQVITGVEALLRWSHPELGMVPPLQFLPLAEETGLILQIGRWVLLEACTQNVAWQGLGVPPLIIAVNVSARQFADPAFLHDIQNALQQSGMNPALLELELSEEMVIQNLSFASTLLTAIKNLGVRIAIDNFGTGYSSLTQLKDFPIDTVKIDRTFMRHVPNNAEDMAITRAIIDMGKTLRLNVVAEGVENADQVKFLSTNFCDEVQGFHFSKPIPPAEFLMLWQNSGVS